jgi:hypothetical protein
MQECGCFRSRSRSISSRAAFGKCSTNQQNEPAHPAPAQKRRTEAADAPRKECTSHVTPLQRRRGAARWRQRRSTSCCAPWQKSSAEQNHKHVRSTGTATLSDRLSRSKGIICPPAGVDPGIAAPAVGGGVTPVIPPPGNRAVTLTSYRSDRYRLTAQVGAFGQ